MDSYIIKKVNKDGYNRFVIWSSFDSLFNDLDDIESSTSIINVTGKLLIDQLFLTGNEDNRFISCNVVDGKLNLQKARKVNGSYFFRKETAKWLRSNYEYINKSFLTEDEREKIKKGIVF